MSNNMSSTMVHRIRAACSIFVRLAPLQHQFTSKTTYVHRGKGIYNNPFFHDFLALINEKLSMKCPP